MARRRREFIPPGSLMAELLATQVEDIPDEAAFEAELERRRAYRRAAAEIRWMRNAMGL